MQYREGQFEAVLPWRHAYQALMAEIRGLTKRINQQLLLEYTYETRIWSSLLNDDDEDVWVDAEARDDSQGHLDASIDAGPFTPGQFEVRVRACLKMAAGKLHCHLCCVKRLCRSSFETTLSFFKFGVIP